MPYSDHAVSDRQAVAQLKYQVRRFVRQMTSCGTDAKDIERIKNALDSAVIEAARSVDFYDDGSRMPE